MQKATQQRTDYEAVKVVKTSESAAQQRVIAPEPETEILLRVQQDCDSDDDMTEPIISYQEHENWDVLDGPAQNTRAQSQIRTVTQDYILSTVEMSTATINAKIASQRKYPKQLLN